MARTDGDVLIVGGGPAGLATALAARQAGLRVIVLDRARPPVDKACGEGLMPDALSWLERMGVEIPPGRRAPFAGIRYVDGDRTAEGRFPGHPGAGVRRPVLHEAMVRRAEALDVDLRWETAVLGIEGDAVVTERGPLRARRIVAADGLHSRLRRAAGLAGRAPRRRRYGVRRHFAVEPWTDTVEVHWAAGGEAYVTPVGPRSVGVALLWSAQGRGFDRQLECHPALRARLAGAPVESRDRGAGPLEQRVRAVVSGPLALVGDASGYVDAIAGEGLSAAFRQASALAEALRAEDLGRYTHAHRRITALPDLTARLLLVLERHPALRRRVLGVLAADRDLFAGILALHVGQSPPAGRARGIVLRLVLRSLAGAGRPKARGSVAGAPPAVLSPARSREPTGDPGRVGGFTEKPPRARPVRRRHR